MFGIHDFHVFVTSAVILNLTPGQDTFYILGRSLAQGRTTGVAAALGISTGSIVHTLAAALGLSAILATSPTAFAILKLIGAGYLVYFGARMLLAAKPGAPTDAGIAGLSLAGVYRQGIITNVTNPKVAVFFLAFLPQFIALDSPTKIPAFLILGATFVSTATLWCLVLAVTAGRLRTALAARPKVLSLFPRAAGVLFIALGVNLAFADS